MTSTESEFVTPTEAAKILGVTRRTVDRYAAEGRLNKLHITARQVLFARAQVLRIRPDNLARSMLEAVEESAPAVPDDRLINPGPRGHERPVQPTPIRGRAFGPAGG